MKKATKTWLIVAISLLSAGIVFLFVLMCALQWDFKKLSTIEYTTNDYTISESYTDISISTNTADITIAPADGTQTELICHEQVRMYHSVVVQDGCLSIKLVDTRVWYDYIGLDFDKAQITLYLPSENLGNLKIKCTTGDVSIADDFLFEKIDVETSTGDVEIKNVQCANEIKIKVSTGDISITNSTCGKLVSTGSTGDISLKNVIVSGRISIQRSTGDVSLNRCDGADIYIKTNTGDVEGTLLSDKSFITQTSTGSINVPSTTGDRCEITTSTGDIYFRIVQ